jgi:hypothetical protein
MENLKTTLKEVLATYNVIGLNGYSEPTVNADETVFTTIGVGYLDGKQFAFLVILVRLVGDQIVIDHDANSDPLYEALLEAGVPRARMILAYAGEPIPVTAPGQ